MSNSKQVNRLIITDKGLEVSKDIKRDLEQNGYRSQWDDFSPKKVKRSMTPANPNLPAGYQASLQARKSVQIMNMPVRSQFLVNSAQQSPAQLPNSSNNFSNNFQSIAISPQNDIFSPFNPYSNYCVDSLPLRSSVLARSSVLTKSHETFNPIQNSSKHRLSTSYIAVNNKKAQQNLVPVQSLGGLKLTLNNLNYQKEISSQNEMQKQQIEQVQQERLAKKYKEWNEKYVKSNELMKSKYYQKYEDISKLGDKEDEENFWRQWHQVKQSFNQCLQNADEQNQRYEERLIRKLNKKYKHSFKTLPNCAKIEKPTTLPKIHKKD